MRFSQFISPSVLAPAAIGALAALLAPAPAAAQATDDALVAAALGVPADDETGLEPAVYLTWWPTGESTWSPGRYALYAKQGAPDDPGAYELAAVVEPRVDELSVAHLLARAERLGTDPVALSDNIDGLFDNIVPTSGMRLAEKLAAVVQVAQADAESAENLAVLARRHPAAALAAGNAFVESIPEGEVRTYEIRRCPDGADPEDCDQVAGRVTVEGGEVRHLPAPGRPVEVPFVDEVGNPDPRGNLNVPLRWATPDALRERAFLRFGYDLFRVDADLARDAGWDKTAPDRDTFFAVRDDRPGAIVRVNDLPVLPDEDFSEKAAPDLKADPETYFTIDDNRRYEDDGEPFEDGDRFVYIVAARDLLGRPGELSVGTPVTICHRLPPKAPRGVQVDNHYEWDEATDTQTQVFRISWNEAEPREDGPEIDGYWIYRWSSMDQLQANQGLPLLTLESDQMTGGRIAKVSADQTEYVDDSGTHPFVTYSRDGNLEDAPTVDQGEAGKTYWYTVRAIDDSACEANISENSAPAYGVLRDRIGPEDPAGDVRGNCVEPLASFDEPSLLESDEPFNDELVYLELETTRLDDRVAWVEYYTDPLDDERAFLGRFEFGEDNLLTETLTIRKDRLAENEIQDVANVYARVGTADGEVSDFADAQFSAALTPSPKNPDFVQKRAFTAAVDREEADCPDRHDPVDPNDPDGLTVPIDIRIDLTPGTAEWKLYRRVGSGPLTLIDQGTDSYDENSSLNLEDVNLPLNGGRICYFLQVFDRHGNPSAMSRIGCLTSRPRTPPPAPMLSPITPLGESPETGGARLAWFAPPDGIERFELRIRSGEGGVPAADIAELARPLIPPSPLDYDLFSLRKDLDEPDHFARAYITGRVGANFGEGPDFELDWDRNFEPGTEYFVRVRAIGPDGIKGPWSNLESFVWSPATDFPDPFDPTDCVVPWPVRGTPAVDDSFPVQAARPEGIALGLMAAIRPENPVGTVAYNGGAVRVGLVSTGNLDVNPSDNWDRLSGDEKNGIFQLPRSGESDEDPGLRKAFYRRSNGEPLLDFALYRYEVPTAERPEVSGDVYQVSPLIDGIAATAIEYQGQPAHAVHDPHVFIIPTEAGSRTFHLWVKDTQPVVLDASYRYLVVRFDEDGEIAQVIPLPTVTAN